ncbi:hypothetical protein KY314_02340, partial [Candidatus Woesearchaeota archaeon]|nr:hypothetical protein [Candidatus Woesearchaeota archaeon]
SIVPLEDVKYRFVFLDIAYGSPFGLSDEFNDKDVSVVYVDSAEKAVTFYQKEKRSLNFIADTSLYSGDSCIFASVFAHDKDMFECGLKKGFARLAVVAEILKARADLIESEMVFKNRPDCVYSAPNVDYLRDIVNNARDLSLSSSFVEDRDKFIALSNAVDGLNVLNENLVQQSCPGIF